jgi:uncharacterized iron-regulated membrane protein
VTRLLFLAHRYLGIAVGLLMAMWCVSGLVMMYVDYPALSQSTRAMHLAPIAWGRCCRAASDALGAADTIDRFRVEMLAGRPVLDLGDGPDASGRVDLSSGAELEDISAAEASAVASAYADEHPVRALGKLQVDQWTLEGVPADERPLYRFAIEDPAGTQLYVSGVSGRLVQLTTRRERFWNWLGAIPHWLYFTGLRRRAWLWTQVVIYTSLVGCFLTAIGLYLGVRQWLRRPAGRWSPYRGFNLWHHMAGLFFGVFTLTWVLSGLLSMNPWGWLEGGGATRERSQLRGTSLTGAQLMQALQTLAQRRPGDIVSIEGAPLAARLFLIASDREGRQWRLDAQGRTAPLDASQRQFIAGVLGGPLTLITRGDDYYFSHHDDPVRLPVLRLVSASGDRYYVDPLSGALLGKLDAGARGYRWWHDALHRFDFAAIVRGRPQWDVLMWLLMSGVTGLSLTGVYLAGRRVLS